MPNEWVSMVRAFHEKFGQPIATAPVTLSRSRALLRADLIGEESDETCEAIYDSFNVDSFNGHAAIVSKAIAGIADGLADTIYVCIGTALEYGIDLDKVFAEVHRTNMLKEGGPTRADGKILKPEGWEPPRIKEIIELDMVANKL